MRTCLLRRLLALVPTLFFASLIVFFTVRLIPGDVIDMMLSQNDVSADPLSRAQMVADPQVEQQRPRVIVRGEVPSALRPPSGCRFHPRCPQALEVCSSVDPVLVSTGSGRSVACHLHAQPGVATVTANAAPMAVNG